MPYQALQQNWQTFSELIENLPPVAKEEVNILIKRYIEQNIIFLNDVFTSSIEHIKHLLDAQTTNDVVCTQAKFTNEINQRLSLSAQRFLNLSLGHITDYNEWLKAHCDVVTD